jgi:short-subunit dehydrogenase
MLFGSQVAITGFRKQGSGRLYNMLGGSFDGKRLTKGMGVYSSTKASINVLTKYLASENKNTNIIVGAISPGILITENWLNEQQRLTPEEWNRIKPMVNMICDHVETATPWITEQIIQNTTNGRRIAWLTIWKIIRRVVDVKLLRKKRDLCSRYGI